MAPPLVVASAISAGASLLGGLFGRKDAKKNMAFQRAMIAEQNFYNSPGQIRARAEEAGFNPLLFVGPGVGQQTGVASYVPSPMGQAIANAGASIAAGISDNEQYKLQVTELAMRNEELRRSLDTANLRPKVPGIYGRAQPVSPKGRGNPAPAPVTDAFWNNPIESFPTSTRTTYGAYGETSAVPTGTDLDELLPGLAMEAILKAKAEGKFTEKDSDNLQDLGADIGWTLGGSLTGWGRIYDMAKAGSTRGYRLTPEASRNVRGWVNLPGQIARRAVSALPAAPSLALPDLDFPEYGRSFRSSGSPAVKRVKKAWRSWRESKGY